MDVRVRLATVDDAAAMAEVHVRSWRWAYREIVPAAYLASLVTEERCARWRQLIEEGVRDVAICEVDGRVTGFINLGASRDAEAPPGTGEIMALYLDPDVWGRGFGRRLADWGRELARTRGWNRWTLWVLRENQRARRFYEAAGFRVDGATQPHAFGGVELAEVRYAEALEPGATRLSPPPSA